MESQPLPDAAWGQPRSDAADAPPGARPLARWRWWLALILVGAFPIVAAFLSAARAKQSGGGEAKLPSSVAGLLLGGALQFGIILVFVGVSWLFSRATPRELWLRWRDGISPVWQGALYSIGLRFLAAVPLIILGLVLMKMGWGEREITAWMQGNRPQTDGIGDSIRAGSALYKAITLTFFSFIVAGLGEELWRVFTMRGLLEIAPRTLPTVAKNAIAVVVSAVVFGIGHLYQGVLGVLVTSVLGIALGAITLHHRSIWPAVIAHGCFDASSFLLIIIYADKIAQQSAWWHWWYGAS